MDAEKAEKMYNDTFPGLTLYYRDAELEEGIVNKYQIGQIIKERGFCDMSHKGGGLNFNTRFLVATSKGKSLSAISFIAEQHGHTVLDSAALFKVLDIYTLESKTQILLLHFPAKALSLFKSVTSNIEDEIVVKARNNFEQNLKAPIREELLFPSWIERTSKPIGINSKGEFISLN